MKKKIIGILVMMLLITITFTQIFVSANTGKNVNNNDLFSILECDCHKNNDKPCTLKVETNRYINEEILLTENPSSATIYEGWSFWFKYWCNCTPPGCSVCVWIDPSSTIPDGVIFTPEPPVSGTDSVSCTLEWTPGYCQAGFYDIIFCCAMECYDPEHLETHCQINVLNNNRNPSIELTPKGPLTVNVGKPIIINVDGMDQDVSECGWMDDPCTLTCSDPDHFIAENLAGTYTWLPKSDDVGKHIIGFTITDSHYGSDQEFIEINVVPAQEPIPGIFFSQVDFTFTNSTGSNSNWGRMEINISEFTEYWGLTEGYINVYSDNGWIIQNFFVPSSIGLYNTVTYFDLGNTLGIDVNSLSGHIEFTSEPIITFGDGDRIIYNVDEVDYNAEGIGPLLMPPYPGPPTPPLWIPLGETYKFIKDQGPSENVECACNQCFPMSIANSLQYLHNRYNIPLNHTHKKGLKGDNTLVGQLDSACNRWAPRRECRPPPNHHNNPTGVWFDDMLEGKFKYLKDNGLQNSLTHSHQGHGYGWVDPPGECRYGQGDGSLPAGNFSRHGITSKDESVNGKVTFEWICEQLKKCEDVELVFTYENKTTGEIIGGHAVRVFGCGKTLGIPTLYYKHDGIQTYYNTTSGAIEGDDEGLEEPGVFVYDIDGDGMLNFGSKDQEICFAFSESPKFPTWNYHFWSDYVHPNEDDVCRGGKLVVWGTINCEKVLQIYKGKIDACTVYSGYIPFSIWRPINDILIEFYWDYACENVDHIKYAIPFWNIISGKWELTPVYEWVEENLVEDLTLPMIGDPTGEIQDVYTIINLQEFLEDPRQPQDMYEISNGISEDLPGYLIGTTPIIFDPDAPPDENPFSTTTISGVLYNDGDVSFEPKISEPLIEIESINGGFGIDATITNIGEVPANNIEWNIDLEGLIFLGKQTSGIIESLEPGEKVEIHSDFLLGFGPIDITVTADTSTETKSGNLLLFLVMGL